MGVPLDTLPASLAAEATRELDILVFGIGAGLHVDGQLLSLHDLLRLYPDFRPKFTKRFIPDALPRMEALHCRPISDPTRSGMEVPRDGIYEPAHLAITESIRAIRAGTFPTLA